jgi:eukaryotic-like serine/threonine-protein kinase
MFLIVKGSFDLLREVSRITSFGRLAHLAATALALALWRTCSSQRTFSEARLRLMDVGAQLGVCACFAWMGYFVLQPWGLYTSLLAVGYAITGRAVTVPSTPARTLVLALASCSGLVLLAARSVPAPLLAQSPALLWQNLTDAVLWSAAATALATVTSKVIYGLQEKAIEARQLGQYTLEQKIGEGGMGEIFRARHAMLRRPTAIKLMTGDGSESALRRFEKEVQLTAGLTHPNTISIYDYGRTPDGRFYYAMELLQGMTLDQLVVRTGPQPAARVIHILLQVCGALREAHGVALIHRDIKPANIFLCARGGVSDVVKVLDFGLVREFHNDSSVTRSNLDIIVGTPLYLSPEAILTPADLDPRADLYALGAVAYLLLTGHPPFAGKTLVELCGHHLHSLPPRPSEHGRAVPEDLERVVLACLAKDRAARPQTASALAEALRCCRDAGCWSEADAELWWKSAPESAPLSALPGQHDRTLRADVKHRLRAL